MRHFHRALVCVGYMLGLALTVGPAAAQTNFSTVVVFGDSLSDTGNDAHLVQSATLGLVRYPSDIPALGFDYTDGRFTDGKDTQPPAQAYFGVWIEQLAASFAATPAVKDSLDGGTNYAFGDAVTATSRTTISEGAISITIDNIGQQVADYFADVASRKAAAPGPGTLFVLWGGANDLFQAADSGGDPIAAAQTAAQNELALVQQLVSAGATSFIIPNLPPLGGTPEYANSPTGPALNEAAGLFAQVLAQGLAAEKAAAAAGGITVNFYQVDIFDLFVSLATNPMAVGLGNVSSSAQNISSSPDTYLIWDGVHPTTTGHHFAAAAAANLLKPLSASSAALSVPSVIVAGQPVVATAKISPGGSATAVPTGLVTFFSGTSVVGSAALDSTGSGTATFSGTAAASPYSITAVYAGDTTYNVSASTTQPLTVLASLVGTNTSLNVGLNSTGSGQEADLSATVTPTVSTYGSPSGTVTFYDGTTSLGTATLSNGVASLTTGTLSVGAHSFTASYGAAGVFGGSTSGPVSETIAGLGFTATANPTSLTIKDGGTGTTTLMTVSTGGFSGTITPTCGTLPAHISCSIAVDTLPLPAGQSEWTLTIGTMTTGALDLPARPGSWSAPSVLSATLLFPGLAGMLLLGLRRRVGMLRAIRLTALVLTLSAGAVFGLSGCGANPDATKGTYMIPVIFTPASGSSVSAQTVNVSLTVD